MPESPRERRIRRNFLRANLRQIRQAKSATADARRRVLNLMRDFEASVLSTVTSGDISFEFLSSMKANVRSQVQELEAELFGIISDSRGKVTVLGETMLQQSLSTVPGMTGVGAGIGGVSPELLSIANEFSADLIGLSSGGLTSKILNDLNRELALGVLGGRTMSQVISKIRTLLGPGKQFRHRAAQIVRTDGLRMFSMANQAALERTSEVVPELRKAWIWSRISRADHAQAEEDFGEDKPIPGSGPFIVAGEALMFPRDPNGSPWNTINCGCFHAGVLIKLPELATAA